MGLLQRLQDVLGMNEEYEADAYEDEGYEEQPEYPYEQRQEYSPCPTGCAQRPT